MSVCDSDCGDLLAVGHIGDYRALAAFLRYAREITGDDLIWYGERTLARALDAIDHRWVVRRGGDEWQLGPTTPTTPVLAPRLSPQGCQIIFPTWVR